MPGPAASAVIGGRTLYNDDSHVSATNDPGTARRVGPIRGDSLSTETAPPDPSVRVKNGRDNQLDAIFAAVMQAHRLLDGAIAGLQGSDSLSEKAMKALDYNFHTVDRSSDPPVVRRLYEIRESLAKTRAAFSGEIPIEVNDEDEALEGGGQTLGCVRDYWIFGTSDIHLLPAWFEYNPKFRAQVVVHEACHKYDNDDDHGYRFTTKFDNLSVAEAIDNADSYAGFCGDVA